MATLVLQIAGNVIGTMIGGPIGGVIGRAVGAVAGASIDSAILSAHARPIDGPRLTEMPGLGSTEGAAIPRIYGRARVGGEVIWATRFEEVMTIRRERGGSSGGKGALGGGGTKVRTYNYFANFAVGLCEGEIALVRRVWADGKALDMSALTVRLYRATADQMPDPLIVAKEGAANAPAYRNLAYIVFERMPLVDFGNRIPQLSFEIVRPVGALAQKVRAVNLIPGAGEFAYATQPAYGVGGGRASENRNQLTHDSDFSASVSQLTQLCPQLESVTLIVAWFGSDLRAGQCVIEPKIDRASKATLPASWQVAGLTRATATLVSSHDGRPAYGGTPSDHSVIQAIRALKARGLKVNLHPFLMMDIPGGNSLPNPWTGAAGQPAYPWRGELTVDPAPGRAGTADSTASATTQIAAFMGAASPAHFSVAGESVNYSGPAEWRLRRFVLHYAALAVAAGGVDGFILSSELRALTRVRGASGDFPMTQALTTLASDVRAIIGAAPAVTYGADWTEYGGIVPEAGTLCFPLDGLWASPAISCVGIDWYPPLSDWRDGLGHADAQIARGAADGAYLQARVGSGEAFDWYYASDAARFAQNRTAIVDAAYGKPWVYRAKDIAGWWSNAHRPRSGGMESAPTAWQPGMKPVWLLEIGCPAVDRGANAPNIFPDAKSSAAGLPHFSRGHRDDLVQARAVAATFDYFDPAKPDSLTRNPLSALYGGRMVDTARTHVWAWDARPFPEFPALSELWGDAENYERGHWLNGRIEGAPLDEMLKAIALDFGLPDLGCGGLDHFIEGYVIDRPMSFRAAIEPLARLYAFGLGQGRLQIVGAPRAPVATIGPDDCAATGDGALWDLRRAQETELPAELTVGFSDAESEFRRATAIARRESGQSRRQRFADTALVARRGPMQKLAATQLNDIWVARETAEFALPPNRIDIETGDVVALANQPHLYQIQTVRDGPQRSISARAIDPAMAERTVPHIAPSGFTPEPPIAGVPTVDILALPIVRNEPAVLQYAAMTSERWSGAVTVWRRIGDTEFVVQDSATAPALAGSLLDPLPAGPVWRWDRTASFRVALHGGALASTDEADALSGANSLAIRKPSGDWEILTAAQAVLEAPGVWRLSRLLRGLAGSEFTASEIAPAGARIVRLDAALVPLTDQLRDAGQTIVWRFAPAGADHADPRSVEIQTLTPLLALRPLAPVHVRARRLSGGVALTWIRQTRGDGDNWELADVPLAEDSELYEIDILAAGVVKRTLSTTAPQLLYAAGDEIADFGSAQASLDVAVYQISAVAGRGFGRRVLCSVLG